MTNYNINILYLQGMSVGLMTDWKSQHPSLPGRSQAAKVMPSTSRAFTLIELLVVMAIMIMIISMSGLAIKGLKGSNDFSKNLYQISNLIEQARSYAMANNTYAYVGFQEVDGLASEEATNQKDAVGRLVVALVVSRDGTYDPSATWPPAPNIGSANLELLSKIVSIKNVHVVDLAAQIPASGAMFRPTPDYSLGQSTLTTVTPLTNTQYTFSKVIQFDSQGVARVRTAAGNVSIPRAIEIGLQYTRGNTLPAVLQANQGLQGAIQISGISGAIQVYRP